MAREIKFRGKYTLPFHEVGKPVVSFWVYGSLIMCCDKTDIVESDGNIRQDINPQTIGQFTGLHDKNGKEIYEGDIIRTYGSKGDEIKHTVEYSEKEAMYCTKLVGADMLGGSITQRWIDEFEFEVIGNIYDNPELLTKEA